MQTILPMNNVFIVQGEGVDAVYYDTLFKVGDGTSRNAASLLPSFWVNDTSSIDLRLVNPFDIVSIGLSPFTFIDDLGRTVVYDANAGTFKIGSFPITTVIVTPLYIIDNSDGMRISKRALYSDSIYTPPAVAPLSSLNGENCEFIDGTKVIVSARSLVYTVVRSFMTIYADNSYTATYDLVADNGAKLTCPEELLTAVPVVTTP